ncbi:MAG TPA: hypothetical protein DCX00_02460 [Flavobacteriales bacterium]|nr:hypothetical protein [Flavobacteriales bacterium]
MPCTQTNISNESLVEYLHNGLSTDFYDLHFWKDKLEGLGYYFLFIITFVDSENGGLPAEFMQFIGN